ncbi:MAG: DUF1648 domain-containing protein [Verrucomicrobia bacterium]|nr:DUF1648 domain-containing protein [Verrucomicrobiota bacterium]
MKRVFQWLLAATVLAGWGQAFWQHDRLPERVATHFNAAGQANGWMTRDQHLVWQIATFTVIGLLFQGLVFLQARLPAEYVNLPHRDYWLAPEHRAATHAWLSGLLLVTGALLELFLVAIFHLVYLANRAAPRSLSNGIWPIALAGIILSAGLVVAVLARFSRRPAP